MPGMTDTMITLREYQKALSKGLIRPMPCILHPDMLVLRDDIPGNQHRFTYAKMNHNRVVSLSVFVPAEPYLGKLCYQIGYAVPETHRNRGRGYDIVSCSIEEFLHGISRNRIDDLYIEAIISSENIASRKIASKLISKDFKETTDADSGVPAVQHIKHAVFTR